MKPGETVRFVCDECLIVFYLGLALASEWTETQDAEFKARIEVTCCPLCGSTDFRATGTACSGGSTLN
jgi:hypothetical protein